MCCGMSCCLVYGRGGTFIGTGVDPPASRNGRGLSFGGSCSHGYCGCPVMGGPCR